MECFYRPVFLQIIGLKNLQQQQPIMLVGFWIFYLGMKVLNTVSAQIERRRSIKIREFLAQHYGHFW